MASILSAEYSLARFDRPVCRLGLAARGGQHLGVDDLLYAIDHGINFLNWCGSPDALSRAVAGLGPRRSEVMVCVQFEARTAAEARTELPQILNELHTDYVDILTFYYVEARAEWERIIEAGGALEYCRQAKRDGLVRMLGLTSHQRPLAAEAAQSSLLDTLMIRYNAAHRGAEQDVFPITDALKLPVVVYTCLRWGALLGRTPDDPPGYVPPRAPAWYRFALQPPSVTVALMAPENRDELEEDLTVLDAKEPHSPEKYEMLAAHGRRVRRHAGSFP
ncbi:MAG TPA: aldo/keto reductase [Gemmataceae bacterium]|jgi:predicted aldo/keto reductase-like oxidoreductase|nr:aldo/keto reductase [Gemmataceae bacterium]